MIIYYYTILYTDAKKHVQLTLTNKERCGEVGLRLLLHLLQDALLGLTGGDLGIHLPWRGHGGPWWPLGGLEKNSSRMGGNMEKWMENGWNIMELAGSYDWQKLSTEVDMQ